MGGEDETDDNVEDRMEDDQELTAEEISIVCKIRLRARKRRKSRL